MQARIWRLAALMLLSLLAAAFAASPASAAGNQVVTGDDEHCEEENEGRGDGDDMEAFCRSTRKYLDHAREAAPDPGRAILAITCNGDGAEWIRAAYDPDPDIVIVCPDDGGEVDRGRGESYDEIEFTTDRFSAIAVGDDEADGGRLNDREDDFAEFFEDGGGIATFDSGDDDEDMDFLPLDVEQTDEDFSDEYQVTEAGRRILGVTDEEVNGQHSQHSSFEEPEDGSPLKVGVVAPVGGFNDRGEQAPPQRMVPIVVFSGGPDEEDDSSYDDEDNYNGPEPPQQQQPSQQLPDPLSFTALFGNQRSASVSSSGLFVVPGMTENCGVGPCNVYERGFTAKPGAQASSHANDKRHGLLSRDRDVLAAGQSNAVRMRLNKAARRKLRRAGRMRIEAMVTVTDAKGRAQLVRKVLTLRAPR